MALFQNICTEVILQWPSTKIAKMVLLGWTEWRPELKIEKAFKRSFSAYGPLSKLLKKFRSAEQNGHQS